MKGQAKKMDKLQNISGTGKSSRKQCLIYEVEHSKYNKCG